MIRQTISAGTFYPAEKKALRSLIANFLSSIRAIDLEKRPKAIIVPHAGYFYSGKIAAFAYKIIKKFDYSKIILLGPSHFFIFQNMSISQITWQTPLGKIETFSPDNFCNNFLFINENIHQPEHSLEVQLPFLQSSLEGFKILPILTSETDYLKASACLNKILDSKTLLVVSSDLSHYLSYEEAVLTDKKTVNYILKNDIKEFEKYGIACGKIPILILLKMAKINKWKNKLLALANSGDISGKKEKVVGYSSFVFY